MTHSLPLLRFHARARNPRQHSGFSLRIEVGFAYVSKSAARDPLQLLGPKQEGEGAVAVLLSGLHDLIAP